MALGSVRLLPVIHHADDITTLRNVGLAAKYGCAGVVLIQMGGWDDMLDVPARAAKEIFPQILVGTNRLSMDPAEAIARDVELGLDLTWADEAGLHTKYGKPPLADAASAALDKARALRPGFSFFASVAFKTQRPEPDPGAAALAAHRRGWIATTSGPATGIAPDPAKLDLMKAALGEAPLAVASGVDPENGPEIARRVDWMLVATGISSDFHTFDEELLARLAAGVR